MKNIEKIFNSFVGVVNEDSTESMTKFLDGEEDIQSDVVATDGVADGQEANSEEELPPEDEMMMDDEFAPPGPPEMVDPNISETQKEINLLNLFLSLKQNVEKIKDLFETCDFTSIDQEHHQEICEIEECIEDAYRKIVLYITDNFQYEKYEKSLYIYLMLRNEALEVTKYFNNLVELAKKEKNDK